jgi:hypothetical protein
MLVLVMIMDHVVKALPHNNGFGNNFIIWIGDLSVFPGLLLSFGFITQRVYFSNPQKLPIKQISNTVGKIFAAYFISATLYRVIIDPAELNLGLLWRIMTLSDVPSYSEFLITFGFTLVLATLLASPIQSLLRNPTYFHSLLILLFLTPLFPYGLISSTHLGLLLGTHEFTAFPVLQYSVFFLLGMYFASNDHSRERWFYLAMLGFIALTLYSVTLGTPIRFPPSPIWILGSFAFAYTFLVIAIRLDGMDVNLKWIEFYGRHVLVILILSNLFVFGILSIAPILQIQSWMIIVATLLVLLLAGHIASRVQRSPETA